MRHRFTKVLFGLVLFTMLAGTATVAARSQPLDRLVQRRHRLLAHRACSRPTAPSTSRASSSASSTPPNGTNKVNGKNINLTIVDDKTDPATAVTAAKDLIGQGYKIIAGSVSSGVALQVAPLAAQNHVLFISGPAASDAITGVNKYTFRSGRQTLQDVDDRELVPDRAPARRSSSSTRTRSSATATTPPSRQLLGGKGHTVSEVSVPADRDRLHAVRAAGQEREPRPRLRRVGRHDRAARCGRRSTSRTCSTAPTS